MKYDTFPLFFQGHSASNVFQCVNGYYRKDLLFETYKTPFYTFVAVIMKRILVGPIFLILQLVVVAFIQTFSCNIKIIVHGNMIYLMKIA